MVQVLCYAGHGFSTCWRPSTIAAYASRVTLDIGLGYIHADRTDAQRDGPCSVVRFS